MKTLPIFGFELNTPNPTEMYGFEGQIEAVFGDLAINAGVGLLESFGSFWASAFKEVIVFTLIIPVLLWRSFQHGHHDEEE